MPNRFHSPQYYDYHGNPKAFAWFWMVCLFIARPWIFFIMAGISREHGSTVLNLFYPNHTDFYWMLACAFPVLGLMLIAGSLHRLPVWLGKYWHMGKVILLLILSGDFYLQLNQLFLSHWQFHIVEACTLVLTCWFIFYVLRSKKLRWLFQEDIKTK